MALRTPIRRTQAFVAIPGVVAVVNSVVAGATAAAAAIGLDLGLAGCIAVGVAFFVLSLAAFALWARRAVPKLEDQVDTRFPSPPAGP
jgi:hypothetical protein